MNAPEIATSTLAGTSAVADYEAERGKPMPSMNHGVLQASLIGALLQHADRYSVVAELSLELDGQPYVPDVSVFRRLDLDLRNDRVKTTDPPLLVVEILSPTQSLDELIREADGYLAAGVQSCWVVQPALEAIAVLLPGGEREIFSRGTLEDPATGITVSVEDIFRPFH